MRWRAPFLTSVHKPYSNDQHVFTLRFASLVFLADPARKTVFLTTLLTLSTREDMSDSDCGEKRLKFSDLEADEGQSDDVLDNKPPSESEAEELLQPKPKAQKDVSLAEVLRQVSLNMSRLDKRIDRLASTSNVGAATERRQTSRKSSSSDSSSSSSSPQKANGDLPGNANALRAKIEFHVAIALTMTLKSLYKQPRTISPPRVKKQATRRRPKMIF